MDWRAVLTTFGLILVAEMGDKTQIMAIGLVGRTKAPWSVLIGSSLALCAVSAIGVFGGSILVRFVPAEYLHKGSAVLFIVIGIVMLLMRE